MPDVTTRSPLRHKAQCGRVACTYNSRLQKGGDLLEDMRLLVRNWQDGGINAQRDIIVAENLLGKHTRARAADTLRRAFLPRFVRGRPPQAWKILRRLEDRNLPVEIIRPVYYWITARNELPIRPINFQFPEFQAARRGKGPTPAVVGCPPAILTRVSTEARFPLQPQAL